MPPRQWFNGLSKRAPAFIFPRQAAHLLNPREGRVIAAYFIIRPRSRTVRAIIAARIINDCNVRRRRIPRTAYARPALSPSFVLLAAALPRFQSDVCGCPAAVNHRAAAVL